MGIHSEKYEAVFVFEKSRSLTLLPRNESRHETLDLLMLLANTVGVLRKKEIRPISFDYFNYHTDVPNRVYQYFIAIKSPIFLRSCGHDDRTGQRMTQHKPIQKVVCRIDSYKNRSFDHRLAVSDADCIHDICAGGTDVGWR